MNRTDPSSKVSIRVRGRDNHYVGNPRDEDPMKITNEIAAGATIPHRVIVDRPEAVMTGLAELKSGDILVITGKGPEKFITIKGRRIPFNDAEAVKEWRDKA